MRVFTFAPALLLIGTVTAKQCLNITVPIKISARLGKFNIDVPSTNNEAIVFALNATKQGTNFTQNALTGYDTVTGEYKISAKYCSPSIAPVSPSTVQLLTHGIGFDKTYWDLPYNNFNYSYIDVATDQYGYHTLSYDRLGIGNSSHGEALNEIQAPLEIAAMRELTILLREAKFPQVTQTFGKVVHVGHSFGSIQSYGLVASCPELSDGLILTGFGLNQSFVPDFTAAANFKIANLNQPRFGKSNATHIGLDYPKGYLTTSDEGANLYAFLLPGYFDEGILHFSEASKQPATIGEFLTLGGGPHVNDFCGPVLVITGSGDIPFCGGDCLNTGDPKFASIPAAVKQAFPKVAPDNFAAVVQPNTGHGINFHYNATAAYRVINEFLKAKVH